MQDDERDTDPDQLVIATEGARSADSLGPGRSLPARPQARHRPAAAIVGTIALLAGLALFAPPPRATINTRSLLKQAIEQLGHDGIALRNVRCPHELALTLNEPFTCNAHAAGKALRVELTPVATRENGPIDALRTRVSGAVGVADVARIAAQRYAADARVTCPHRLWIIERGERAMCTMSVGNNSGPLTVVSNKTDGELTLNATWTTARADTTQR